LDNRPSRYHRAFTNGQTLSIGADNCAAYRDDGILFDDNFSRPSAVCDNCGTKRNDCPVVNLHTLGILVFEIDIITDEDLAVYLNAAQSMQEGPQIG